MPICNLRYRCHLLCNPWSRGNHYKQHMPLALRLGILHRRRSPQSRRLLRLKGYIMEKHSTPYAGHNQRNRLPNTTKQQPLETGPDCTCPVFPWPRVCNVDGCTTSLSRHNQYPFCNSCRKAEPSKLLVARITRRPSSCSPRDYDGIESHTCN